MIPKLVLLLLGFTALTNTQNNPPAGSQVVNRNPTVSESTTTTTTRTRVTSSVVSLPSIPYLSPTPYNYAEALAMSMLFYEAQRSGALPREQRVRWRGDSALTDGSDNQVDLSGGYYDGGGYIKYGFPMAFTTTTLSWGVIRYRRAYEITGQLGYALDTIKWATDYFIKCHPSPNEFYAQVATDGADKAYYGTPEEMTYARRSFKLDLSKPGSDLAAETAAALAAASIVFEPTDPDYSQTLLTHALDLYDFADRNRGKYSDSISVARLAYMSKGYIDELAWAAAWIYKRNGEKEYLNDAERFYKTGKLGNTATEFSWNYKGAGVQALLAELKQKGKQKKKYMQALQWFCEWSQRESTSKFRTQSRYTRKGLLFVHEWGPLRYAASTAFVCLVAADLNINSSMNRVFASEQIDYILGKNGRSFLVGFGEDFPLKPFHKSSYCPEPPAPCSRFDEKFNNAHTLYGALIGGPSQDDSFADHRENQEQSSVAIDYNAGFQSALAGLLDLYVFGPDHRPHEDPPGVVTVDLATPPPPTATAATTTAPSGLDYDEVLGKSLLFYEAQRSGLLTSDNRITWRADSALADGSAANFSLIGGYYDGSSYVKYTFPLAYTITVLSWGLLEFKDAYINSGQYSYALDALTWGLKYLIRTQNNMPRELVTQVGNDEIDSLTWDRPEDMDDSKRPVTLVQKNEPGSAEVAAETAAAMAAASAVFYGRGTPKAKVFSSLLYNRSQEIFSTMVKGNQAPQTYLKGAHPIGSEYPSSGYNDELAWAAMWLFKSKRNRYYYDIASRLYSRKRPIDFSWDNKTAGVQLLMGVERNDPIDIGTYCNWLLLQAPRTPKGLLYLKDTYTAKYAANAAMILLMTAKNFPTHSNARKWRNFGISQINYLLGQGGQGYVVGFGSNPPDQPYHKASSCPVLPDPCGFTFRNVEAPNLQVLNGALVGGPDRFDLFSNQRLNEKQSRVSLDGNAGFQSAVTGVIYFNIEGNTANGLAVSYPLLLCHAISVLFYLNQT